MNAQNSSRVSATSCGTIQATASWLAGVARLAHFLTLEKRAFENSGAREGMNLYLWDFGVDSSAAGCPQNLPAQAPQKPTGQTEKKQ